MKKNHIYSILLLALLSLSLVSCIRDDRDDCGLKVRFVYDKNMLGVDAFAVSASEVNLWVFDNAGNLVLHQFQSSDLDKGMSIEAGKLAPGSYKFVAWAQNREHSAQSADFAIPALAVGDNYGKLCGELQTSGGKFAAPLNAAFVGVADAEVVQRENDDFVVNLRKITNKVRVILMPNRPVVDLKSDNYDITIADCNARLEYDASNTAKIPVVYSPYSQRLESADSRSDDAVVDKAVVADFDLSRLFVDDNARLSVKNVSSGTGMLDINLAWLLTLQGIGENKWGAQEYLDRQDYFSLTFFFDGDTWMQNRIVVNGWVLSLSGIELD